jgi:hypothetical protein
MFALNKQALQRSEEALQGVKPRLRIYGCYAHQLCEVGKLGKLDSKKSKSFSLNGQIIEHQSVQRNHSVQNGQCTA